MTGWAGWTKPDRDGPCNVREQASPLPSGEGQGEGIAAGEARKRRGQPPCRRTADPLAVDQQPSRGRRHRIDHPERHVQGPPHEREAGTEHEGGPVRLRLRGLIIRIASDPGIIAADEIRREYETGHRRGTEEH